MAKQKPGFVQTSYDELTYRVNGLAMQVHNELKPGHPEKFYQRRLAELCHAEGWEVELEKRVEVWVQGSLVGYMFLDLWINDRLVVECKALSHLLTNDEVYQAVAYLVATGTEVGMLYNFGQARLEYRRIFPPADVQGWQRSLYRATWVRPGLSLPALDSEESVVPIRFVTQGTDRIIELPSASTGPQIIRSSVVKSVDDRVSASKSVDYASAGVNIDSGNRAVELMKQAVKSTYNSAVLAGVGSFGGLFDAALLKAMRSPVLVASTDGVGTKVKLAAQAGRYGGIGQDIVNHCINDILVQGARPLFFMDYFATSRLDPAVAAEVVTGIAEACKAAGMALLGGETAEMPGVYEADEFDVAGTIVGVVERDEILPRPDIQAGDVLLGLTSSGPHTNGYSLLRSVFADVSIDAAIPEIGGTLADALLAPHRSYLSVCSPVLSRLKALVHITGGGFTENIPRVMPADLDAAVRTDAWPAPPLWKLIQEKGGISTEEMFRVFNMGIGMIMIVDKKHAQELQDMIPEAVYLIGQLVDGSGRVILK